MPAEAEVAELANRLEAHFQDVFVRAMAGLPICNPALSAACVGFREWRGQALGIIVTPWFMNVVLAPLAGASLGGGKSGETRSIWLPAGKVDFLVSELDGFGLLLMCSLFSPMQDFADQAAALATAEAALAALLDESLLADAEPEIYPFAAELPRKTPAERGEDFLRREADGPPQFDRRAFLLRGERKAPAP